MPDDQGSRNGRPPIISKPRDFTARLEEDDITWLAQHYPTIADGIRAAIRSLRTQQERNAS